MANQKKNNSPATTSASTTYITATTKDTYRTEEYNVHVTVEAVCMKCTKPQNIQVNQTTATFWQGQRKEVLAEECRKCKAQIWLITFPTITTNKMDAML